MSKKLIALLLPLILLAQNVVFALNPYPMELSFQSPQAGSSSVFDLTTFTVEVTNVDGSKFDLWEDTQLIVGQNDTFLTAILYNDAEEEIDTRALNLDNPYVELADDGKKVVLTYNAKDLMERGVNTASGLYVMEIVNIKPGFEMETRVQSGFSIQKPEKVDTVNLQRKILQDGMDLRFTLASNEEKLDYLPLGYAHPDIDLAGRDYLAEGAEIGIYDEEINLLASYSGGDIKWNYDGTYSYIVDGPGKYLMSVTNTFGDSITADFTVEPKMIMDVVGQPNPVTAGGVINFNISFMDDLPIRLPIVNGSPLDLEGNIVWENFELPELYKFNVYEKAEELILRDTKYLYLNNADDGDVIFDSIDMEVDTGELELKSTNDYVAQVILQYPDKSFVLGQAEFSVKALVPGVVQIGNNIVAPGIPVSVAVYDLNDKPVDLIEGYRLVVYGDGVDYNGQNHLLSSDDGDFTDAAGTGNYTFVSPNVSGKYSLALYDGNVLSGVFFKVEVPLEAEEAFVFPGDDHIAGLADEDEEPGLPVEGDNLVEDILVRCVDVEEDYWAFGLTNALLDAGMYPVVVEEGGYNCRPLTQITRKEFTTWLLKAYRPEDYALVADMDLSDVEIPFPDLDLDDPFTPYVVKAAELDIIHGHPDGTFRPDLQINRAEVLKILLRSSELFFGTPGELLDLQLNHPADMPTGLFSDVDAGEWYYPYLYFAVVDDIIEGYGDGTARMGQGIIFSEAAKILYLAKQLEGIL